MIQVTIGRSSVFGLQTGTRLDRKTAVSRFITRQPDVTYFEGDIAEFVRDLPDLYNAINSQANLVTAGSLSPERSDDDNVVVGALTRRGPGSFVTVIAIKQDPVAFVHDPVTGVGRLRVDGRSALYTKVRSRALATADQILSRITEANVFVRSLSSEIDGADWTIVARVNSSQTARDKEMDASRTKSRSADAFGELVAELEMFSDVLRYL